MENKTVFVIGAGASQEANLPTGQELKEKIVHLLDIQFSGVGKQKSGDKIITEALYAFNKATDRNPDDINTYIKKLAILGKHFHKLFQ